MLDLQGFPMAIWIHEATINRMLYDQFTEPGNEAATSWHVSHDLWTFQVDESKPPTVDFNTNIKQGCRLRFEVTRGHFKSWVLPRPGATQMVEKKTDLAGVVVYLVTPMKTIRHRLQSGSTWADADFFVQALLTDLSNIHEVQLELSRPLHAEILSQTSSGAAQGSVSIESVIQTFFQETARNGAIDLHLSSTAHPQTMQGYQMAGLLAPTACTYSTYRVNDSHGTYQHGYLILLPMLDQQPIPMGDAVGVFNQEWPGGYRGVTMLISDGTFLHKFIWPALLNAFPYAQLQLQRGELGTLTSSRLSLVAPFSFSAAGHSATMTKLDCYTFGGAWGSGFYIDYEFHATVSHWSGDSHAGARGRVTLMLNTNAGILQPLIDAPPPDIWDAGQSTGETVGRVFGDIFTLGFDEAARASDFSDVSSAMAMVGWQIAPYLQMGFPWCSIPTSAIFRFTDANVGTAVTLHGTYY